MLNLSELAQSASSMKMRQSLSKRESIFSSVVEGTGTGEISPFQHNQVASSPLRDKQNYSGLINQSNSCYLNTILQLLRGSSTFKSAIYNWKYDSEVHGTTNVVHVLQQLFAELDYGIRASIPTVTLTKAFGWDSGEIHVQHDVCEAFMVLVDAIDRCDSPAIRQKLKDKLGSEQIELSLSKFVHEHLSGKMEHTVQCETCGFVSSRLEEYLFLPVPLRRTLKESIEAFLVSEKLEGDNAYFCERCNTKVTAIKSARLPTNHFPDDLFLQLNRFEFDPVSFMRRKKNDPCSLPMRIDFSPYLTSSSEHQDSTDASYDYELVGVGVHSGGANGGHYFAYVKPDEPPKPPLLSNSNGIIPPEIPAAVEAESSWYMFNDSNVMKLSEEDEKFVFNLVEKESSGESLEEEENSPFILKKSPPSYRRSLMKAETGGYLLHYRRISRNKTPTPVISPEILKTVEEKDEELLLARKKWLLQMESRTVIVRVALEAYLKLLPRFLSLNGRLLTEEDLRSRLLVHFPVCSNSLEVPVLESASDSFSRLSRVFNATVEQPAAYLDVSLPLGAQDDAQTLNTSFLRALLVLADPSLLPPKSEDPKIEKDALETLQSLESLLAARVAIRVNDAPFSAVSPTHAADAKRNSSKFDVPLNAARRLTVDVLARSCTAGVVPAEPLGSAAAPLSRLEPLSLTSYFVAEFCEDALCLRRSFSPFCLPLSVKPVYVPASLAVRLAPPLVDLLDFGKLVESGSSEESEELPLDATAFSLELLAPSDASARPTNSTVFGSNPNPVSSPATNHLTEQLEYMDIPASTLYSQVSSHIPNTLFEGASSAERDAALDLKQPFRLYRVHENQLRHLDPSIIVRVPRRTSSVAASILQFEAALKPCQEDLKDEIDSKDSVGFPSVSASKLAILHSSNAISDLFKDGHAARYIPSHKSLPLESVNPCTVTLSHEPISLRPGETLYLEFVEFELPESPEEVSNVPLAARSPISSSNVPLEHRHAPLELTSASSGSTCDGNIFETGSVDSRGLSASVTALHAGGSSKESVGSDPNLDTEIDNTPVTAPSADVKPVTSTVKQHSVTPSNSKYPLELLWSFLLNCVSVSVVLADAEGVPLPSITSEKDSGMMEARHPILGQSNPKNVPKKTLLLSCGMTVETLRAVISGLLGETPGRTRLVDLNGANEIRTRALTAARTGITHMTLREFAESPNVGSSPLIAPPQVEEEVVTLNDISEFSNFEFRPSGLPSAPLRLLELQARPGTPLAANEVEVEVFMYLEDWLQLNSVMFESEEFGESRNAVALLEERCDGDNALFLKTLLEHAPPLEGHTGPDTENNQLRLRRIKDRATVRVHRFAASQEHTTAADALSLLRERHAGLCCGSFVLRQLQRGPAGGNSIFTPSTTSINTGPELLVNSVSLPSAINTVFTKAGAVLSPEGLLCPSHGVGGLRQQSQTRLLLEPLSNLLPLTYLEHLQAVRTASSTAGGPETAGEESAGVDSATVLARATMVRPVLLFLASRVLVEASEVALPQGLTSAEFDRFFVPFFLLAAQQSLFRDAIYAALTQSPFTIEGCLQEGPQAVLKRINEPLQGAAAGGENVIYGRLKEVFRVRARSGTFPLLSLDGYFAAPSQHDAAGLPSKATASANATPLSSRSEVLITKTSMWQLSASTDYVALGWIWASGYGGAGASLGAPVETPPPGIMNSTSTPINMLVSGGVPVVSTGTGAAETVGTPSPAASVATDPASLADDSETGFFPSPLKDFTVDTPILTKLNSFDTELVAKNPVVPPNHVKRLNPTESISSLLTLRTSDILLVAPVSILYTKYPLGTTPSANSVWGTGAKNDTAPLPSLRGETAFRIYS